jgi:hypothetical protein
MRPLKAILSSVFLCFTINLFPQDYNVKEAPARIYAGEKVYWTDGIYLIKDSLVIENQAILIIKNSKVFLRYHADPARKARIISRGYMNAENSVFTSERDDTYGDINKDSLQTIPRPGDWGYLDLAGKLIVPPYPYNRFFNTTIKYGGGCKQNLLGHDIENAMIYHTDGRFVCDNNRISHSHGFALRTVGGEIHMDTISDCENGIKSTTGYILMSGNMFQNIRKFPFVFENCLPEISFEKEKFTGNGIQGIAVGGTVKGYVGEGTDIVYHLSLPANLPPLYIYKTLELKNLRLTFQPGAVIKFLAKAADSAKISIIADSVSIIEALGTEDSKIVFTSEYDFDYKFSPGFDFEETAHNSHTPVPFPSDWGYIKGRRLNFEYCDFRYGGVYYDKTKSKVDEIRSALLQVDENYNDTCSIRILNCSFKNLFKHAILTNFQGHLWLQPPLINNCSFYIPNNCFGVKRLGEFAGEQMIDARFNYWNSKTGPFHEALNPSGNGCMAGDGIDFKPYLKASADSVKLNTASVKGKISNNNRENLANAKIQLKGKKMVEAFSDSVGNYTLSDIVPGSGYRLAAYAPDYVSKDSSNFLVYPDTVQYCNFTLRDRFGKSIIDTLNFNINPVVSHVGEGGTAYRYYKIVDKKSLKPVYGEKVYVDDDLVFDSEEDGMVTIMIPSAMVGTPGANKTFQITKIGEESVSLEEQDRIHFMVEVEPYSYLKSWAGEAYIQMGIISFQAEKRRGSSFDLLLKKSSPDKFEADSIYITRKSQNGIGFNQGVGAGVQMGDVYTGAEAEVGVNAFKILEDNFKFDYKPGKDNLALAQFIVLADGMLPYMDAPLVRLFVRCLEQQNTEIKRASISNTLGLRINSYGTASAGLSLPENPMNVNLNANASASIQANVDFRYSTYTHPPRIDFALSLNREAEGDISVSADFGMLNLVKGFGYAADSKILNPINGNISARVHGDLELGTARYLSNPYTWLTVGYGYEYDVSGRISNKETSFADNKDNYYKFIFEDSSVYNVLKNSTTIAKSFLSPLSGKMDLAASNQSIGNTFTNTFHTIAKRQKYDPLYDIKLPYEKTVLQEFSKDGYDISLSFGISVLSMKFGMGYNYTGLYKYTGEKGVFYDYTLYPFEEYPAVQNAADNYTAGKVIGGIVNNAAGYVWQKIVDGTNAVKIFKRIGQSIKELFTKSTGNNVMPIGPESRNSSLTFLGYPEVMNDTTEFDSVYVYYWDWEGTGEEESLLKSTAPDIKKIRNYVRSRATSIHKLDYGIGGFYQFEPYNTPISGDGGIITINYRDDELTVMLNDSSTYNIPEENLRIYKENKEHNTWIYVGGQVIADSNFVVAHVDTLGTFTLAPFVPKGSIELKASPDTIRLEVQNTATITSGSIYYDTDALVADGELFTIALNKGSVITPDAGPDMAGTQVAAKNGMINFVYQADSISGIATVKLSSRMGNAMGSLSIPIVDSQAPQIPVIENAYVEENDVAVNWTTPADPDLAGFKLYYDTVSGGPYHGKASVYGDPSPILLGNVTSALVNGLQMGKTYYFSVTATDRCNNESGYSNEYMLKTKFNSRPVLYNRKYIIQPGLPKGTIVDTLMAEDADVGQTLTFYLDEENTCDVFSLDPVTGTLKVDKPEKLTNLTADTTFEVKAGVRDNGDIQLFDDALIWIELDIKTHISKPESEEKYFEIKPNPASSALEVHFFTKEKNSGGKIKILTGQGQIVYSKDYPVRFPETDLLDVSSILPGAYFIVIQTKEEKGTEKLIIVR